LAAIVAMAFIELKKRVGVYIDSQGKTNAGAILLLANHDWLK